MRRFSHGAESSHPIPPGDLPRRLAGHIVSADKLDLTTRCELGVNPRVFFAQRTGAQHSDFDPSTVR